MNEIRAPELLLERYNTHFLGLVNKLSRSTNGNCTPCNSPNKLASLPFKDNMLQRSLKVKIQNAINKAILADAEDRGVFVGGRRRNRKKKRNKNNGKDRKKQKKNEIKTSSLIICGSGSGSENDDEKPPVEDKKPLIEPDFCDYIDVDDCEDIFDYLPELVEDQENIDPETMPFGLFKKKEPEVKKDEEVLTEVNGKNETDIKDEEKTEQENEKEAKQNPFDKVDSNPDVEVDNPDSDGTTEIKPKEVEKTEQKSEDVNEVKMNGMELNEVSTITEQPKGTTVASPKEESPLINKSGTEKNFEPSCLCCTIL